MTSKTCNCDIYEKLKKLTEGISVDSFNPPVGYNPISEIRNAMFMWVPAPFFNNPIWCKLKCLNMIEIKACGNLSCLYFDDKKKKKENTIEEIIEIKQIQENLAKESLIYPVYDDIIKMITGENFIISQKEKIIKELKIDLEKLEDAKQKKELSQEVKKLEYSIKFLLPDDTYAFVASWALGIDKTNILKISKKILFQAAVKAVNGHNNPTDHISGVFTDFQFDDINNYAWIIYNEYQEQKRQEKEANKKGYQLFTKKVV